MISYQFHGPARVCAASGRELPPGERVFSVLRDEGGQFVRTAYAPMPGARHRSGRVVGKIPKPDALPLRSMTTCWSIALNT